MTTGEARMPDAASLPPRSAPPRDVDIPVLPGVTRYEAMCRRTLACRLPTGRADRGVRHGTV